MELDQAKEAIVKIKEKIDNLSPQKAFDLVGKSFAPLTNWKPIVIYSCAKVATFKDFQLTKMTIPPLNLDTSDDYESLFDIESFLVYGGYICSKGKANGCIIEKHKDGSYLCVVTNDSIHTKKSS
jgi:hypothetical protein